MSSYSLGRPRRAAIERPVDLNHDPALIDAGTLPPGYRRYILRARIGTGADWYQRARAALSTWTMFDQPWISLDGDPPYERGHEFTVISRVWPLWISSPVRVLDIAETDLSSSVLIGALDGHPLSGLERFSVTLDLETRAVTFEIDAVSKPVGLAAVTRPAVRLLQRRFRNGAADAMAAASRPPRSGA